MVGRCFKTDEWMEMWYVYTTEIYSEIKKCIFMPFTATRMELKGIMLGEISQRRNTNTRWFHLYAEKPNKGSGKTEVAS